MSSNIPSFTQPYRLAPYNPEEVKKKVEQPKIYHVFKKYEAQLNSLSIPVPMEMMDYELTTFKTSVDETLGVERKITTMVRQNDVDWLGDKKRKEFFIWYETWTGFKDEGPMENGERRLIPYTVADFPCGLDKQMLPQAARYDTSGKPIPENPSATRWVHTQIFDPKLIEEVMQDTTDTGPDTIQFIVNGNGTNSWGGFTMEEFSQLTFEELEERGRKGTAGTPVQSKVKKSDRGTKQEDGN